MKRPLISNSRVARYIHEEGLHLKNLLSNCSHCREARLDQRHHRVSLCPTDHCLALHKHFESDSTTTALEHFGRVNSRSSEAQEAKNEHRFRYMDANTRRQHFNDLDDK